MKFLFLFIFILQAYCVESQILSLDKVIVSRVISVIDTTELGNHELGPVLSIDMRIINTTEDAIFLHPSKSTIYMKYFFNGKDYLKEIFPFSLLGFFEKEVLSLKKGETYVLQFSDIIFLDTDILHDWNEKNFDYSLEILQTLPTLTIIYKEDKLKLSSCGIKNIEINDYRYTPNSP